MEVSAAVQPLVMTHEGYSAFYGEEDPEELKLMQMEDREKARKISEVLREFFFMDVDLTEPHDGEGLYLEIGTTEDLAELRQIAAAAAGYTPDDYYEGRVPAGFRYNHLINHSDTAGYYLPLDFPQPFILEEDDLSVGSAVALGQELEALRPILTERYSAEMSRALAAEGEEEPPDLSGPVQVWDSLRRLCQSALDLELPIQLG